MEQIYHNLLRIHDACRGLSDEEVERLAKEAEVIRAEVEDLLQSADRPVDSILIVVQGVLKVVLEKPGGRKQTVRFISAGDQFGAMMLLDDDEMPLDVLVEEPAILLRLKRESVFELAEKFPVFRRNLLRKVDYGVRELVLPRHGRRMPKIVAFVSSGDQTRGLVDEFVSRLSKIGEHLGVLSDSATTPDHDASILFKSIRESNGEILDKEEIRATMSQWTDLSRILIVLDRTNPQENLVDPIEIADAVYCLATTDDFEPSLNVLSELHQKSPSWRKKTRFIWVLRDEAGRARLQA